MVGIPLILNLLKDGYPVTKGNWRRKYRRPYSVVTEPSWPSRAALRVCQGRMAHLMRVG